MFTKLRNDWRSANERFARIMPARWVEIHDEQMRSVRRLFGRFSGRATG